MRRIILTPNISVSWGPLADRIRKQGPWTAALQSIEHAVATDRMFDRVSFEQISLALVLGDKFFASPDRGWKRRKRDNVYEIYVGVDTSRWRYRKADGERHELIEDVEMARQIGIAMCEGVIALGKMVSVTLPSLESYRASLGALNENTAADSALDLSEAGRESVAEDDCEIVVQLRLTGRWGSKEEVQAVHAFEEALSVALEQDQLGVTDGVEVGDGVAEVFCLVSDEAAVLERIVELLERNRLSDRAIIITSDGTEHRSPGDGASP